jgi:hypothetical protein
LAAAAALMTSTAANAGVDPAGCTQTGVAITVSIFRADGTTGVVGPISECETVIYQARLAKSADINTICAFSGSDFSLTTPDGVKHVISLDVPCIGGEGIDPGCDASRDFLDSDPISYTVKPADVVGGFITATARYGVPTPGFVHDNTPLTQGATATTPKANTIVFCDDNNLCTIDECDESAQGSAACSSTPVICNDNNTCTTDQCNPNTGLCDFTPVENSTPCADTDNNACTTAGCEAGSCVQTHIETICTPDTNPCTNDPVCDTTTGQCNHPPVDDSTPCPDNDDNACTTAGCEQGTCIQTHQETICQPDNNPCTNDPVCDTTTGQCNHPPVDDSTPCPDNDSNLCTTAGCESGSCVQDHHETVCTPDNNPCTNDPACDPSTGQCTHPPVDDSTPCPDSDNNLCNTPGCESGSCVQTHIQTQCNDNDPCTDDSCNPATGECEFVDNGSCNPSGCRVTGGGKVDACGPIPAGCNPATGDCAPDCPDFAALDATHGGQVGAPIGAPTAFSPDSVCIQGEWTHVRHLRPGLKGNFHTSQFDSLMCACLPCAENPDSPGVVGALCNPGDRICGPEPRRAPDNKICFSGLGNYALSKGKRTEDLVIFRVDIEDRSEPGGGNGPQPPDRYRLRLWLVDATDNHGDLGDPTNPSSAAYALRQAVGCADPTNEAVTAPTPDIEDGGDMIHGNHQIHPSLNKTCDQ